MISANVSEKISSSVLGASVPIPTPFSINVAIVSVLPALLIVTLLDCNFKSPVPVSTILL